MTLIVSLKYVFFVLRFDNRGEGGVLALLAYASRLTRANRRLHWLVAMIAIFAASLFYGDAVITPAISVLSAVEGLSVATPAFESWVLPIAVAIIVWLFKMQKHGTGGLGKYFGAVTVVWFLAIAALGMASIAETPRVLGAVDPRHALGFAVESPGAAFLCSGRGVPDPDRRRGALRRHGALRQRPDPHRLGRAGFPGADAELSRAGRAGTAGRGRREESASSSWHPIIFCLPLVGLATAATVIASQATISGAFSITQQASRLGYLPHIPTRHTSESERGQIYIPQINWVMLVIVVLLVLGFGSSSALAAAYGIAVSGTMLLSSALVGVVAYSLLRRARPLAIVGLLIVGGVELLFLASNTTKIADGGWFPLLCGLAIFTILSTWKRATEIIAADETRMRVRIEGFFEHLGAVARVPGTAIYLSSDATSVPTTLLHNLKHNKVLHERVVLLALANEHVPRIADKERTEVEVLEPQRIYRVVLHYGFMEDPDMMHALHLLERHGLRFELADTTFFLGKSTITPARKRGLFHLAPSCSAGCSAMRRAPSNTSTCRRIA
ncbi:MAG: KUP/HAK/KT family potassium transporter [Rhodopseudomonas palustris]|nr:KUP/HAK/KT family potassium transporter [Rhodopseudomonas palustris]